MKRSHIIALSGISCAMALICVVGSIYVEFMTLSFAVLAAVCIQMPLTQKYWLGGILSYVATSIFAFLIGNINALPFILFFGAYTIIQWGIEQKLYNLLKNRILKYSIGYIIKLAYFEIVIAIFCFCFSALVPSLKLFGKTIELSYLIIGLAGIPFFLIYDVLMHYIFKNFTFIINKIIKKTTRTTTPDDIMYNSEEEKKDDCKSDNIENFQDFDSDSKNDSHIKKENEDSDNKEN